MADDKNTLELISQITEFNDLHEFMKDEHLDKAMSTKFAVMSSIYSTIAKDKAGTPNNNKKNVYYSVKESIDKLVDALKYVVRYNS